MSQMPHCCTEGDAEYDESKPEPDVDVCVKCLTRFPNCEDLEYHSNKCAITDNNYRRLKLPKERQYLQLGGSGMKDLERLHTWMFSDFEYILPEDDDDVRGQQTITASQSPPVLLCPCSPLFRLSRG